MESGHSSEMPKLQKYQKIWRKTRSPLISTVVTVGLGDLYMSIFDEIDTNWKGKFKSLAEFYKANYPSDYFEFNRYELAIDPLESFEEIEGYDEERRHKEMIKCALSFSYFCHKYVKIAHPKKGLLPFILYKYQKKVIDDYEKNRFCILSKFRQGGLTTVTVIWAMWRCLFKLDETIMVLSKADREAIAAGEIVKRALEELPSWMKPEMAKNNDHQKLFSDTGCKLFFYTPEAARGRAITYLILDEAAFIPQMDKHWKAMFPTISTGGHCICISTVNGVGNWYYDIFTGAKKTPPQNDFHIIELDYWEHPEYNDPNWIRATRAQLGEKGWMQEVLRDFLGAGDSFIPPDIINDLDLITRNVDPLRKLFPKWNNLDEAREERVTDVENWDRGALHIWRAPVDGRDYIIGVDCAEGMGDENDNSCFEVIDQVTCEQVAEFYSNVCPPHNFAQILAMVGKQYNHAVIIVESASAGLTVLEKLEHELNYDNIFESAGSGKQTYKGIKTSKASRPKFLETMQTRLINESIAIRSRRLVKELKGFIWNAQTKRAEATKGFHDDAIIALCLALYARDQRVRQVPAGYRQGLDDKEMTEAYKLEIYESVKEELSRNTATDWFKDDSDEDPDPTLDIDTPEIGYNRRYDKLFKEFGW